jgi:hypothetical protein
VSNIFTNPNQLEEWVDASLGIQEGLGIEKALGYLIGERFYNLVGTFYAARKLCRLIQEETKKPDYNAIIEDVREGQRDTENLETYQQIAIEADGQLLKFAFLISQAFPANEIRKYFKSHPPLGAHGHVSIEEHYECTVNHRAIEHSMEQEVEDALRFGDMLKYFGMFPDSSRHTY